MSPAKSRFNLNNFLVTLSATFFFVLGLTVPEGYSVTAVLLIILTIGVIYQNCKQASQSNLSRPDYWLFGALLFYALIAIIMNLINADTSRYYDKPLRFIIIIPVIYAFMQLGLKHYFMLIMMSLGSLSMLAQSAIMVFVYNVDRAAGYTNAIQYGNLAIMLGFFCLAGFIASFKANATATNSQCTLHWLRILYGLGFIAGIATSLLSGSRGGWVFIPVGVILCIYWWADSFSLKRLLGFLVAITAIMSVLYVIPETKIQDRVGQAIAQVDQYQPDSEAAATSVGARIEMWRLAAGMFAERPLSGWGNIGYKNEMKKLVSTGQTINLMATYDHPHNEVLNAASKYGIFGVLALLVLYLVPFVLFVRYARSQDNTIHCLSLIGAMLPCAYATFGLTQTFLSHNNGVMYYLLSLVFFWGSIRYLENTSGRSSSRQPYAGPAQG